MIRNTIKESLRKALKEAGFSQIDPDLLPTSDLRYGDYFTNVALKLSSLKNKQDSTDIAKSIMAELPKESDDFSAEIAKNGLINFRVSPKFLQTNLRKIIEAGESYGRVETGKEKKARVEFISANPTGPLHIGNARGGPLGDALASILEFAGYKVLREYLDSDRGNQVQELGTTLAVLLGLIKKPRSELTYTGQYTKELARLIKGKTGDVHDLSEEEIITKVGEVAVKIMFKDIIKDAQNMGIKFDLIVHESQLHKKLPPILKALKEKGLLKSKDKALWFAPRDEFLKDKDAVVVKSDGSYTYFATDIVYHKEKFETGYDQVIDVFGSNTSGHVPKLKALITSFGYDISRLKIILYQFVRIKRGEEVVRMSKRSGDFVTAREVLDEVGKDAFRFYLLMFDPSTHMDFDLKQAKEKSKDNPVYYVQYAHARASNILKTAKESGFSHREFDNSDTSLLRDEAEWALMRKLLKLPELIEDVSKNFAVHLLPAYAIDLADLFHKYYERGRVIGDDRKLSNARLNLVFATKIVLRNTLNLLGISAPDRM